MYVALSLFSPDCFHSEHLVHIETRFLRLVNWLHKCQSKKEGANIICLIDPADFEVHLSGWARKYLSENDSAVSFVMIGAKQLYFEPIRPSDGDEDFSSSSFRKKYEQDWDINVIESLTDYLPDGYLDLLVAPDEIDSAVDAYGIVPSLPDLDDFFDAIPDEKAIYQLFNLTPDPAINKSLRNFSMHLCLQDYDIGEQYHSQNYLLDLAAAATFLSDLSVASGWLNESPEMDDFFNCLAIDPFILGLQVEEEDVLAEEYMRDEALRVVIDNRRTKVALLLVDSLGGHMGSVFTLWQAIRGINNESKEERYEHIFDHVTFDDHELLEFSELLQRGVVSIVSNPEEYSNQALLQNIPEHDVFDFVGNLPEELREEIKYGLNRYMPHDFLITNLWNTDNHFEDDLGDDWYFDSLFGSRESIPARADELAEYVIEMNDKYNLAFDQTDDDYPFDKFVQSQAMAFISGWRMNCQKKVEHDAIMKADKNRGLDS